MKKFTIPMLASAALIVSACAETETVDATDTAADETSVEDTMVEEAGTIVDVASGNENFSTLVSAVVAADLGETLSGDGPFTVFAPTNDAFGKVDEATLNGLMAPEGKEALSGILTYHVVAGNVDAAALTAAIEAGGGTHTVTTVNGAELSASVVDGAVILTDAAGGTSTVTMPDVAASNGVIHAIDTVLMPS